MIISTISMIISITMIITMMSSLSVPSAFHGGGARAIRTDIMVMVTRMDTAMAMEMDMVMAMDMDTARTAGTE
jgi:hypothetical protein